MKKGWLGLLLVSAVAVAGCQHGANAQQRIRVLSADGALRQEIVTVATVETLQSLWQNRKQALVKMRPAFNHRVEFSSAASEQWLYSEAGYAVLASEPYGTMYLMAERERINALLDIK